MLCLMPDKIIYFGDLLKRIELSNRHTHIHCTYMFIFHEDGEIGSGERTTLAL